MLRRLSVRNILIADSERQILRTKELELKGLQEANKEARQ